MGVAALAATLADLEPHRQQARQAEAPALGLPLRRLRRSSTSSSGAARACRRARRATCARSSGSRFAAAAHQPARRRPHQPAARRSRAGRFPAILQDAIVIGMLVVVATFVFQDKLLTTSAVGAVVVGFALQDTLGNAFAGLAIQSEKPFRVGHWIRVGDFEGRVAEVTWRATKLRTKSGNFVVVPNNIVAKEAITNYSEPAAPTRLEVEVGASYLSTPADVQSRRSSTRSRRSPRVLARAGARRRCCSRSTPRRSPIARGSGSTTTRSTTKWRATRCARRSTTRSRGTASRSRGRSRSATSASGRSPMRRRSRRAREQVLADGRSVRDAQRRAAPRDRARRRGPRLRQRRSDRPAGGGRPVDVRGVRRRGGRSCWSPIAARSRRSSAAATSARCRC